MAEFATGMLWATRGRRWGFRLLLTGGVNDPLRQYEVAFAGSADEPYLFQRPAPGVVALRFPDPDGRQDESGRVIPHEFVLLGGLGDDVQTPEGGQKLVWPIVAATYASVWDSAQPPPTNLRNT